MDTRTVFRLLLGAGVLSALLLGVGLLLRPALAAGSPGGPGTIFSGLRVTT